MTLSETDLSRVSVFSIGLSRRVENSLARGGIRTLAALINTPDNELMQLYGIGMNALEEIHRVVESLGDIAAHQNGNKPGNTTHQGFDKYPPDSNVEVLPVSLRTLQALRRAGIRTLADLASTSRDELMTLGGLDRFSIHELDAFFRKAQFPNESTPEEPETVEEENVQEQSPAPVLLPLPALETLSEQVLLDVLLKGLNERQREIVCYRYGLAGMTAHTLQETGEYIGVTRERVRQILQSRITRVTRQNAIWSGELRLFRLVCREYVDTVRVTTVENMAQHLADKISVCDIDQLVSLLTYSIEQVFDADETRFAVVVEKHLICAKALGADLVSNVHSALRSYLDRSMAPLRIERLVSFATAQFSNGSVDERVVQGILENHPDFTQIETGEWALVRWRNHIFDDIIIALRALGRPAHFSEITRHINARVPENEQVTAHTVHAQLGRHTNLFIRTDSGTFALREQFPDAPLQPPKYVDLMEEVFEEAGTPLDVNTVHERVSTLREAKLASIIIYLGTHERFTSYGGGLYGLAKWRHDERLINGDGVLIFSYCPPPLLPSRGNARIFFDSILVGRKLLTEKSAWQPRDFYAEMLAWAQQKPTRERDVQSAFDAWYAAGLISPVTLTDGDQQPLKLMIPAEMNLHDVRVLALNTLCQRILKMPEILSVLDRVPEMGAKALRMVVFGGEYEGLDIGLRLNMLAAFEAVRADGMNWRITDVGRAALRANPPQELPDLNVIEMLGSDETETDDWDDYLNIFTF